MLSTRPTAVSFVAGAQPKTSVTVKTRPEPSATLQKQVISTSRLDKEDELPDVELEPRVSFFLLFTLLLHHYFS